MIKLLSTIAFIFFSFAGVCQSVAYKVNKSGAPLYNTNIAPFKKLATLPRGEVVLLLEQAGGTMKVSYNGKVGFMGADNLVLAGNYFEDPQNAWHPVAIRKDNQIMAATALPIKDAYKAIHQYLIENNFNIEKNDEANSYITATTALTKGLGQGHIRLNIYLKAEDSTRAYYQGTFDASVSGIGMSSMDLAGVIEKVGMKGSTMENAFSALNSVAHSIPDSTIRYRKKPKQ